MSSGPSGPGPVFFGPTGAWATGPTGMTGGRAHRDIHYLVNRARIELTGASHDMVKSKTTEILFEFFDTTSIWSEQITGEFLPNVTSYWVDPQESPPGEIIRLGGVFDRNNFPISARMTRIPVVELPFTPTMEQTVTITMIKTIHLAHDNDLPSIPYWIVKAYEPALLAGILYKMQIQPNRAYSDNKAAQVNYNLFHNGMVNARADALRKFTFGTNAWAYPQNFQTRSQHGNVSVTSSMGFRG